MGLINSAQVGSQSRGVLTVESSRTSAAAFVADLESRLLDLAIESQQADWVYSTYITEDSEALSAQTLARYLRATVDGIHASKAIADSALDEVSRRKLHLLRVGVPMLPPSDPAEALELTRTVAAMTGVYGKGVYTPAGDAAPLDVQGLSRILAESRDPRRMLDVWQGWHRVGRQVRTGFERYVELANRGAVELGFADTGALWRSRYDMAADAFAREVERLWRQVQPLYLSLHAYVRRRLSETYGTNVVPAEGPIPAHLLGNMWAQSWENLLPVVAPPSSGAPFDLTEALKARATDAKGMVRFGEGFFLSLGLPGLPPTFWERSMFEKPRDREVVCHASAWDIDYVDDLRLKMCIEITGEDFGTVHHELGHNYYQRAYAGQPYLFRDGANDGFHEAIGDAIALSVTPQYLRTIGLRDDGETPGDDLRPLLETALGKVAFLPFGLLIDLWRWRVFDGSIPPAQYNRTWWELRREYQGVAPPEPRADAEFDPGAKFHVPANVPYMRYFLAHILQFQFHRALVRSIGWKGPLHLGSIYGSKEAGRRFSAMLALGQSRPWPDALELATGERRLDGGPLLEYFAPLQRWLDEQNRGHPVGW